MDTKLLTELHSILKQFGDRYFINEDLNKARVIEDFDHYNHALIVALLSNPLIKKHYSKTFEEYTIIETNKLIETFEMDDFWMDSYTKYTKKIGLTSRGRFIDESTEVVLDFPYKDTVLKAGMTKEDIEKDDLKPDEPFYNEVIAAEEIDVMLDKKILVNAKKYDVNGVHEIDNFDDEDNLIIKGNNLLALYTLKDKYAGKIKMIYIDPPYNTGKDSFEYNDHFNHSAWLTFIKSRIEIAKELLLEDGLLFISLDDNEVHYAKVLVDEIFGRCNFISDIAHKSRASVSNDKIISNSHNHILLYAKNERLIFENKKDYGIANDLKGFNLSDNIGNYRLVPVDGPGGAKKGNPYYEFLGITGYWRFSKETMQKKYNDGLIVRTPSGLQQKYYETDAMQKKKTITTWWDEGVLTSTATRNLKDLFGEKVFDNPKNEYLLKRIIEFSTKENDIVLDFFMGSATTQAVAMKMNRQFIGVEQMDYINTVSVPRLQKVIEGEQGGISKDVGWQGGGSFVYAELMEKSKGYIDSIYKAKDSLELRNIYHLMLNNVDINFRVDLQALEEILEEEPSLDERKKILLKVIDKNQLYYNYSEIDDENVRDLISDTDYAFNRSFYKGDDIIG